MLTITICALLIILTTLVHYEALGWLNARLPSLKIPNRSKLIVVIVVAFLAHAIEIALYGGAFYAMGSWLQAGTLTGAAGFNLANCMYFSAETFTSLGFGDLTPIGPIRMLVGVEALNGLLLIGWSASFTYICMERFWVKTKD
jgi:hypothetical protein